MDNLFVQLLAFRSNIDILGTAWTFFAYSCLHLGIDILCVQRVAITLLFFAIRGKSNQGGRRPALPQYVCVCMYVYIYIICVIAYHILPILIFVLVLLIF